MTKRGNTILFIVAATGFNIVLTGLIFVFMFALFFVFIKPFISDNYIIFGLPVVFMISILISFILYRAILKRFLANVDMDKYFDTAFTFKKKTPLPEKTEPAAPPPEKPAEAKRG
ncbi:MAG: hypothetical protein LBH18_04470 [Spirochaetaceae bacterium]|jgi:predicted membrane protein|nr:hypothetical protein [Spirochaetaceae bacterium]